MAGKPIDVKETFDLKEAGNRQILERVAIISSDPGSQSSPWAVCTPITEQ